MSVVIVTILTFGIVMSVMALGVIFSNRPLRGSCGGTGEDCSCSAAKRRACAAAAEAQQTGSD